MNTKKELKRREKMLKLQAQTKKLEAKHKITVDYDKAKSRNSAIKKKIIKRKLKGVSTFIKASKQELKKMKGKKIKPKGIWGELY